MYRNLRSDSAGDMEQGSYAGDCFASARAAGDGVSRPVCVALLGPLVSEYRVRTCGARAG